MSFHIICSKFTCCNNLLLVCFVIRADFLQGSYEKIIFKYSLSFPLLLLDRVPFPRRMENKSYKEGIKTYTFRIKTAMWKCMFLTTPIAKPSIQNLIHRIQLIKNNLKKIQTRRRAQPPGSDMHVLARFGDYIASCYRFSCYYRFSDIAINSVNPSFI